MYDIVKDFNASPDMPDNSSALQSAIAAWSEDGQSVLKIPPGVFTYSQSLQIQNPRHATWMRIEGDGGVLSYTGRGIGLDIQNPYGFEFRDLLIRGLRMKGSAETALMKISNPLNSGHTYRWKVQDCVFEQANGHGLEIENQVFEGIIDNCMFQSKADNLLGIGIYLHADQSGKISSIRVRDCNTRGFKHGLYNSPAADVVVDGGTYLQAQQAGLNITGQPFTLMGVHAENNWQGASQAQSPNAGVQVAGYGSLVGLRSWAENRQKFGVRVFANAQPVGIIGATYPVNGEKMFYIDGTLGAKVSVIGVGSGQVQATANPEVSYF